MQERLPAASRLKWFVRAGKPSPMHHGHEYIHQSPLLFFLLVFALTTPLWLLSRIVRVEGLPDHLPVTDVGATFVPLIAAAILVYREEKLPGVKVLLKKILDFGKIQNKAWYVHVLFLMPLLYLLTYWLMRWAGLPIALEWHVPASTPLLFLGFFVAAAGEELGYMGYAIDPMLKRRSALSACLIMGPLWAIWHFPSMIQIGQSRTLMAWGFLATVSFRILYVWLYNNTGGCVFAVIVFHAIANTGRSIFPGGRSHFELANAAIGYSLVSVTAIIVTFLWGAKTLSQFRFQTKQRASKDNVLTR